MKNTKYYHGQLEKLFSGIYCCIQGIIHTLEPARYNQEKNVFIFAVLFELGMKHMKTDFLPDKIILTFMNVLYALHFGIKLFDVVAQDGFSFKK